MSNIIGPNKKMCGIPITISFRNRTIRIQPVILGDYQLKLGISEYNLCE